MSPTKGQKMTPKVTRLSSDKKPADKKSSNSPYGKVLELIEGQNFHLIKIFLHFYFSFVISIFRLTKFN